MVAESEAWEEGVIVGEREEDSVGVEVKIALTLGLPLPLRETLLWALKDPTAVLLASGLCVPD